LGVPGEPTPAPPDDTHPGDGQLRTAAPPAAPRTGELEVYGLTRREVQGRSARRGRQAPEIIRSGSGRGDGTRARIERWSRWAAGLGLPPRDADGTRRHPGWEKLFPPAVWVTAALGVAAVAGLITGILVSGDSEAAAVPGTVATTTATVTNATTAPPVTTTVTRTRTRTRTKTLTVSVTPTNVGQGAGAVAPAGGTLAPGSFGPEVVTLQQELAQLGLFQGAPTGSYDQQTQAAVQNFQARTGITADPPGVAGPTTRAAIDRAVGR
jgi:hypothetical protein